MGLGVQGPNGRRPILGRIAALMPLNLGLELVLPGPGRRRGGGARPCAPGQYLRGPVCEGATI